GVRGEPGRPAEPENGLVWRAIADHIGSPGYEDEWVTVTDLPRSSLAVHPWSLTGGGATALSASIDASASSTLGAHVESIGFAAVTGEDAVFISGRTRPASWARDGVPVRPFVEGDKVRDFQVTEAPEAAYPYTSDGIAVRGLGRSSSFWPFRTPLRAG